MGDLACAFGGGVERLVEQAGEPLQPLLEVFGAEVERGNHRVKAGAALGQADSAFADGRLARANADAAAVGVTGTPTLTVRRGDGPERTLAASPLDAAAVQAELAREAAQ